MKIPKKDYTLLVGIAEFHFKFAEYVRESDSAMFFRAIDYARTYTKVDGLTFDYWHEDNKKFLLPTTQYVKDNIKELKENYAGNLHL